MKTTKIILTQNVLILIVIICNYVAEFVYNFFLAKHLTATLYGDISLAFEILVLIIPLVTLGNELTAIRFIPKYLKKREYAQLRGFIFWTHRRLVITTIYCFLLGIFFILFSKISNLSSGIYHSLAYLVYIAPFFAYFHFQSLMLRAFKKIILSALSYFSFYLIYIAIFYVTVKNLSPISLNNLLFLIWLTCIIIIIYQFYFIRINLPLRFRKIKTMDLHSKNEWSNVSIGLLLVSIVFSLLKVSNFIMLKVLDPFSHSLASYAAIIAIARSFILINQSIQIFFGPLIARSTDPHHFQKLQKYINVSNYYKLFLGTILIFIIILYGKHILHLFSYEYTASYYSLIIVSIAFFINLAVGLARPLLLYTGKQLVFLKVSIVELALLIFFGFLLIPKFHLEGAAIALLLSVIVRSFLITRIIKKNYPIKLFFVF